MITGVIGVITDYSPGPSMFCNLYCTLIEIMLVNNSIRH